MRIMSLQWRGLRGREGRPSVRDRCLELAGSRAVDQR